VQNTDNATAFEIGHMVWRQTPWSLCNRGLSHCQKVTITFLQFVYLINRRKLRLFIPRKVK